jgi:type IV pilus assembly protein PilP
VGTSTGTSTGEGSTGSGGDDDPNSAYSFNPLAVKRDPFTPPSVKGAEVSDLRRYDLNEMNLVAILMGMGAPQAMIQLPNGKTHIVQVGTPIGRRNGKVFKIKSDEVVVRESFTDYQNRVKSDFTSLVIAQ